MKYWMIIIVFLILIFFIVLIVFSLYEPIDDTINAIEKDAKNFVEEAKAKNEEKIKKEQFRNLIMFTYGMGILKGKDGKDRNEEYTRNQNASHPNTYFPPNDSQGPIIVELSDGHPSQTEDNQYAKVYPNLDKNNGEDSDIPEMSDWTIAKGPICKKRNCGKLSKGEKETKDSLYRIFGKEFYTTRPNFLKNPETNRNLEIDCYNHDLSFAVEYNGKQHYEYPNGFHRTEEQFIKQVSRDKFKKERCDSNGIFLLSIPWTVDKDNIEEYIRKSLPYTLQKYVI